MVKKPGISLLKNLKRKGKKPTPPKRVKLSKVKKDEVEDVASFEEFSHEEGLEDTPDVSAMPEVTAIPALSETLQSEIPAFTEAALAEEKRAPVKKRKGLTLVSALHSTAARVLGLFASPNKKSKGKAAALEFAESRKRLGRKGRRNRRILVYAGSGFVVVAVMLLVFLVPGGAAAPANTAIMNAGLSESVSDGTGIASTAIAAAATPTPTASPTPVPTTKPEPSDQPIDMDELLKFYVVEADKYYSYSNNHYEYTQEELKMLAQVIYKEARGQTRNGKIAVGNVIMNRVLCPGRFGRTIKEVVTAPGQFAYDPNAPTPSACISAARWVLDYELWVVPQDVYYFRASSKFSSLKGQNWGSHTYYGEISGHYFYRHAYRGRTRGGDIPPQLFERVYKYAQYGCKVEDRVVRIQFMLDALGYKIEKIDGYFGLGTEKALIKFQQDHGLDDDGVAGPTTVQRLIEEYGVRDYFAKYGP